MAMQQCPNGHLYDDAKNGSCPYCSDNNSVNVTVPLSDGQLPMGGNMFPQTAPLDGFNAQNYEPPQPQVAQDVPNDFPSTVPLGTGGAVTMALDDEAVDKVRGWLVCVEGQKVGADFKIRSGNNTIGRGASNVIKIDFDTAISKGVNAILTYDVKNNKFFIFFSGESKNNIYVNEQLLMTPVELKDYDIIEIGQTKLLFRSLCNDIFNWENIKKN